MTDRFATCEISGFSMVLLPFPSLYWEERKTLLVADVHLGKTVAFRAGGIPVPESLGDDLDRLSDALTTLPVDRLLVLGDLVHGPEGLHRDLVDVVYRWRHAHRSLTMGLVPGNHDCVAHDVLRFWRIDLLPDRFVEKPFVFCHDPDSDSARPDDAYRISGHIHPAVTLTGGAHQRLRLPCFVIGRKRAILPAFGGFTGNGRFRPRRDDRIFVLAGETVQELRSR